MQRALVHTQELGINRDCMRSIAKYFARCTLHVAALSGPHLRAKLKLDALLLERALKSTTDFAVLQEEEQAGEMRESLHKKP